MNKIKHVALRNPMTTKVLAFVVLHLVCLWAVVVLGEKVSWWCHGKF